MQSTLPCSEMLDAAQRHPQYCMIPGRTLEALWLYINEGVPTGSFLEAVLTNNLRDAVGRADQQNTEALSALVSYLYNECPSQCWGSEERVENYAPKVGQR